MTYNPQKHHRRSIRLKGYDYSRAGLYFVTICCQGRAHRFGEIRRGIMGLNDPGCMAWHWYERLAGKFSDIHCDEMIVMPNHVHFIVEILPRPAPDPPVGVDPCVHPKPPTHPKPPVHSDQGIPTDGADAVPTDGANGAVDGGSRGRHVGLPLLPRVVQWYKTMTTNAYIRGVKELGWEPFDRRLWLRNYYEHIIRNEAAYERIAAYIRHNPQRWAEDKFHQA